MKIIIGIDPGASGSIAWINERGDIKTRSVKKESPLEALKEALNDAGNDPAVAFLERLTGFIAIPGGKGGPNPSTMFKMGVSAGYWEGLLAGLGVKTILVRPQEWQTGIAGAAAKKGPERKRALKAEAVRRFPKEKITLLTCDAMLIAEYGARRVFEGESKAKEAKAKSSFAGCHFEVPPSVTNFPLTSVNWFRQIAVNVRER